MHGNVWNGADWFSENYYADSPIDDPSGPVTGTRRVNRGVDAQSRAANYNCRSAQRGRDLPGHSTGRRGFRIAAELAVHGKNEPFTPPKYTDLRTRIAAHIRVREHCETLAKQVSVSRVSRK